MAKIYGTDALRYTLIQHGSVYKDIKIEMADFKTGKLLANKIWNAGRYILTKKIYRELNNNLKISENNSLIITKLEETIGHIKRSLETYDFSGYAHLIRNFFWNDFCAVYLENTKKCESLETYKILYDTYLNILKLFHPIMPFITEHIYQIFKKKIEEKNISFSYDFKDSIMLDNSFL